MLSMISPRSLRQSCSLMMRIVKKVNPIQLDVNMDGVTSAKHRRSKHVAVERSLKMQTPQLRRSLWSQRRRRLSQRRQR